MRNRKTSLYCFIVGLIILVAVAWNRVIPITSQTRFLVKIPDVQATVIYVVAVALMIVGIIGMIRYKNVIKTRRPPLRQNRQRREHRRFL
ncbi:MAG: hypothetical protein FWD71_22505 [Oscillospiraceae bacterium]|nr:hypothetical protein [Oscillospiraceae bacterium]